VNIHCVGVDPWLISVSQCLLRPCDWKGSPFCKLQALPKDARAVTTWSDRDEAFTNVAEGIRRAVERLL
jgi:hypothetical protein